MPEGLFALDTGFPAFAAGERTEQKVEKLQSYLYMLLEQLRYILRNLGVENFNESALAELEEAVAEQVGPSTVISNTLITNELYADYGAVADLTVWKLRTDYLRAYRYLQQDTSALDYLYIHGEQLDFITGTTDGTQTEQLSIDGLAFYWTDAGRTQMTSQKVTAWPVTVYVYEELTKLSVRFQPVTLQNGAQTVMPVLVLGAGDENGNSRGYVYKDSDGLYIKYQTSAGASLSVKLTDSGYVDILKQRRPTAYDFSTLASGYFTETADGGQSTRYTVTTNADGDITKLTDPDGHETAVIW